MTIIAAVVIVAIILIVGIAAALIIRFLKGAVDGGRGPALVECAGWFRARKGALSLAPSSAPGPAARASA